MLRVDLARGRLKLSIKELERSPGDMLRDPRGVYEAAEEMAEAYRGRMAAVETAEEDE